MAKKSKNFLDFVPAISQKNTWDLNDGKVTISMKHTGFYNMLAQKVFHTPEISRIDLDEYGSFIWQQIDGKNSVGDIAIILKEKFGDDAEPLYDRIVMYMQILYNNKFITYVKKGRDE